MAESILEGVLSNNLTNTGNITNLDCAVCLQTCIHPAELPCGHIFCYLCIKGIVNQGRRCAMCRQDIPVDYLDKPVLLKPMDTEINSQGFEDGHLWFYEGHNGWWQYDDRTSIELESAYQKGERCCELLIAGFLYVIDFYGMIQCRRNDPSRRRRIKRDIATTIKKGIAGIKVTKKSSVGFADSPDNLPNEINQNSTMPNPPLNGFASLRNLNSGLSNPVHHTETTQSHVRTRERNLSSYSHSACETAPSITQNSSSNMDNTGIDYSLDSTMQNTLDWAIEQIESLNLELLNDYETILLDYGQFEGNTNLTRQNRTPDRDGISYLNVINPVSEPDGIDLESGPEVLAGNKNTSNKKSEAPAPSNADTHLFPEVRETEVESSESVFTNPPQPFTRNRSLTRLRSLRDFQQRTSEFNCDKILKKYVSDK